MSERLNRPCMLCGASVHECMGAVLPRDILAYLQGQISSTEIREICDRCQQTWDVSTFIDPRPLPSLNFHGCPQVTHESDGGRET